MISRAALVSLLAAMLGTQAWNYDRCDTVNGPAAGWGGFCYGLEQTPINLCGATPIVRSTVPPPRGVYPNYTISAYNYQLKRIMKIQNTGHTLQISPMADLTVPFLRVPGLHHLVNRAEPTSKVSVDWVFAQMHLHWGREGDANEGSEHTMEGRRFPAELHLVHYNKLRGTSLAAALATGAKDALLVVGVFLELADTESNIMTVIAEAGSRLPPPPANTPELTAAPVLMTDLFNPTDAFYSYGGSLTTPGCNEQVTWVVLKTPKTIRPESLELLKMTMETVNETVAFKGNFRPLQPLGDRVLYFSKNISNPCQTVPVPDPCYTCTAAPAMMLYDAKTQGQTVDTSSTAAETPAWVWVAIGVSVPTVAMMGVGAMVYFGKWRKQNPTEGIMMSYSPFTHQEAAVANSATVEWVQK